MFDAMRSTLGLSVANHYSFGCVFNFEIDNSKESGLGLIELRLKSKEKLYFYGG